MRHTQIRVGAFTRPFHHSPDILPALGDELILLKPLQSLSELVLSNCVLVEDDILLLLVDLHEVGLQLEHCELELTGWDPGQHLPTHLLSEVAAHYQHLVFYLLDYLSRLLQRDALDFAFFVVAGFQVEE